MVDCIGSRRRRRVDGLCRRRLRASVWSRVFAAERIDLWIRSYVWDIIKLRLKVITLYVFLFLFFLLNASQDSRSRPLSDGNFDRRCDLVRNLLEMRTK